MADPYDFIAQQEGFRPKAYWDNKQWSIGFGTKASGPDETIDQDEAHRRLRSEADKFGGIVDKNYPGLDPTKRAALTSFTYNLGPGWMTDKSRLSAAVQAGDWNSAARIMQEYNNANGQPNAGLTARRQRESAMLLGGDPSAQPPPTFTPTGRPMPYDDETGRWIPEDVIKQRRGLAAQMYDTPSQGGKFAGLGGILAGLGNSVYSGMANRDTRSNQDMQRRALENAAGAPDNVTLARHLMGVPPLQAQGLGILANSLDPAKKQALEAGAFELGHKKVLAPTQEEMARVQLEAAKRKDWFDEFAKSLIGVPSTPAAGAPSAPASPAAPSPQSPSAPIVPAGGAGLPGVPGISVAPPAPAAAAPAPTTIKEALPTSQEGLRAFLMKRPQHEREAFIVAMKTKPEEALKMLHDWTDPEKKGREAGQVKLAQENAEILANKPKNRVIASSVLEGLDRMDALAKSIHNNKALGFATGGWSPPQSTMAAIAMPWRNTRPGSKTSDVEGDIHTLVSQVGFNTLQAMREASKTGGALGNVSEKELAALQNALTTIGNTSISKEKYRENLRLIQVYAKRVRQRTLGAWKDQYGEDFAEPGGDAPPSYANPAPTAGAGAAKADPLGIRQ